MANAYKVLGQAAPSGGSDTLLYTVPAATQTVISTLTVVNRDTTGAAESFRVAVVPSGQTLNNTHYIEYEKLLASRDSKKLTIGISLATGDKVYVRCSQGTSSFSLFGAEIT